MAESDRRPGESERDWMRRVQKLGAASEQCRKDQARQDSADAAAEEQAMREEFGDEVWLFGAVKDLFGMSPDQLDAALDRAQDSTNWDKRDQKIMDELSKVKKPRWFEGKKARNRRVAKHLKNNKGKIAKAAKKGKKGWFW